MFIQDTCASAYVDMSLTKSATTKFANDPANKPIIDFIKKYSVPTADVNKSLGFYMDADGDLEATAKDFLKGSMHGQNGFLAMLQKKLKLRFNF